LKIVEGDGCTRAGPEPGFSRDGNGIVHGVKELAITEEYANPGAAEDHFDDVPLTVAHVVLETYGARLSPEHGNGPRLPVLNMKQSDIVFIGAELQQIVVLPVLVTPDEAGGSGPPLSAGKFELDAEIAIAAGHLVENGEGGPGLARRWNPREHGWAAGRGIIEADLPALRGRPTRGKAPGLLIVEIDCVAQQAEVTEGDQGRGDSR